MIRFAVRSSRFAVFAVIAIALSLPSFAQVTNPKDIKTPPLRKINMPTPKRIQLPNGMVILMMEDHELPLIQASASIHGGGRDVPLNKTGLTDVLGEAWRTGGTQTKTGDELDEFLEARAARVETAADEDSTSVSMNVLKDDFNTVFPIFLDVLRNPAFRQDKIDLAKTQLNAAIARRNDEPGEILSRELTRLGFGKDSPYAAIPEYATVASITRDDLVAFHKRFVQPNNIIFAIGGDFDSAAMEKKLRDAFASWPRGPQAPPPSTAITAPKPGVYYVAKSDVTQSNLGLVAPGIQRNNPDYYAVRVMNEILGGGFSGRLVNHIRTQRGLAYDVGGGLGANWDYPGLFEITMGTKSGATLEAIQALRDEVSALQTSPFTADELKHAKDSILNRFIFTMDSREKMLTQAAMLEFYGFPADYYRNYPANIEKVTAEDVARVAKKYVDPNKLAVLVVGNEKEFDKPLSTLGTVTPIDITIPEVNAAPSSSSSNTPAPASNAEGAAVIEKITNFVGGKAKIAGVNSIRQVTTATQQSPQGAMEMEIDSLTVYPDSHHLTMKTAMGEMQVTMTPDASFMIIPGMGTRDMPGSQRDMMKAQQRQDMLTVLKNPEKYSIAVVGSEKVNGADTQILQISAEGESMKWYVDPSGKVVRKVAKGRSPMAQGDQVTDFLAYGTFNGITLPVEFKSTSNGQELGSGKTTKIEINPAVDQKIFAKPAS